MTEEKTDKTSGERSERQIYQCPRGTHDIVPSEIPLWLWVESTFREMCRTYRYGEIRTPLFEYSNVIHRTSGVTSDIVSKETYDFRDRDGESLTLRAEGTAPVVRAAIQDGLLADNPYLKLAYIAPMFRHDRPQAGRYRQHHQIGIEALGSDDPATDAEVIAFSFDMLNALGIKDAVLRINTIGSPDDRPRYREALVTYFTPRKDSLSEDSRRRLETNPLRILDSKDEQDRAIVENAPSVFDYLTVENAKHFEAVLRKLDMLGIAYDVDQRLVRGLDYYTRTAFEWVHGALGAQSSVGGGGRYNGLVEALGGPPTPGIGWGMGIERLLLAVPKSEPPANTTDIYVVVAVRDRPEQAELAARTRDTAFLLCQEARKRGFSADFDTMNRSLKAQMKSAGKIGARYALILGENEMANGTVTLRDMLRSEEKVISRDDIWTTVAN